MSEPALGITIVGGGVYAPRLCEALARAIPVSTARISLSARDQTRLHALAVHAGKRVAARSPGWSVTAAPSLTAALDGASLVILLARIGGFAARSWDEEFPRRYGLVGDEGLGPGGIANAWRTVPELERIGDAIRRVAPASRILNLMAPLGVTTRLLLDRGLAAFGLCELPLVTLERWRTHAGASPGSTSWHYAGLNHLGWFWGVEAGERDALRLLADSPELAREGFPIDGATLERFRAAPLRYYYQVFDPAARARFGLERRPGRARELETLSRTLLARFSAEPGAEHPEADRRPTPWLDLAVAPVAAALLDGAPHDNFINLRNGTLVPELPADQIVELAATFTDRGAHPARPGPLPTEVAAFLRRIAEVEGLAYDAAIRRDPERLVDAIAALPLPIGSAEARELAALARQLPPLP